MKSSELLNLFQQLGVVASGHFVLSSGQHSDEYWEKFRLLEWPRVTEQLCREIALRYEELAISAVIGPTTGGAIEQFGVPCHALITVSARTYSPDACPMCTAGIPLVKPGTRGSA